MAPEGFDRRTRPDDMVLGAWTASDGWRLRTFDWVPAGTPRGSILFEGGRGDFIEKYLEAHAHWHGRGWAVSGFDWRGQGGSGRTLADRSIGHLDSFEPLLGDLADYMAHWLATNPPPHVLIGHSMGAHLLLRLLAERKPPIAAAVLVAPMLALNTGRLPPSLARLAARLAHLLGFDEHRAWRPPEQDDAGASRQSRLTGDSTRYADERYWRELEPEFVPGSPSWGWVSAAFRSIGVLAAEGALEAVATPVLLVGSVRDRLVQPEAIAEAAARLPNSRVMMRDDAAHEMLRERDAVREPVLAAIDAFLDSAAFVL